MFVNISVIIELIFDYVQREGMGTMNEQSKQTLEKAKYEELKAVVKKLEEKNYSRLIVFRSGSKDWYKMGGNSVLIYKNQIVPHLKMKANIQPDTDFTKTLFEDGVVSFRGTESLQERLQKIEKLKRVTKKNDVVVFDLTFVTTIEQMEQYREELRDEKERACAILKANIVLAPEVYGKLKYIQKRIFETVRKMTVYERSYNGMVMAEYSRLMTKNYMMMNNNMISEKEGWSEILRLTNLLIMEVTFVTELNVLRSDVGANIGAELIDVRKASEKALRRLS